MVQDVFLQNGGKHSQARIVPPTFWRNSSHNVWRMQFSCIHVRISCPLCTMWKSADRNISTVLGCTGSIIYGAGGRGMGVSKNLFWYKKLGYNMLKYIDLSKDFTLKYYLQGWRENRKNTEILTSCVSTAHCLCWTCNHVLYFSAHILQLYEYSVTKILLVNTFKDIINNVSSYLTLVMWSYEVFLEPVWKK